MRSEFLWRLCCVMLGLSDTRWSHEICVWEPERSHVGIRPEKIWSDVERGGVIARGLGIMCRRSGRVGIYFRRKELRGVC
ncbi:hypothetical protein GE09DRAFT_1069898 [Coniochaeta sp. 2T2.1]|nr:hypothetical protein GE09DRAFT_1069898 [Coniochaeta sp. 2T2.1]